MISMTLGGMVYFLCLSVMGSTVAWFITKITRERVDFLQMKVIRLEVRVSDLERRIRTEGHGH